MRNVVYLRIDKQTSKKNMQRIVIKDFGPITNAEIDLKRAVVLIGEQATGKSTVAKLVYYFKSLQEKCLQFIYLESMKDDEFTFDEQKHIVDPVRKEFYNFFGNTTQTRQFCLKFYYSTEPEKYLELQLNAAKQIEIRFSSSVDWNNIAASISDVHRSLRLTHTKLDERMYFNRLSDLLQNVFCHQQEDNVFVVAGRNATVGYSESFEQLLLSSASTKRAELLHGKMQTIDETLIIDFMRHVAGMKDEFKSFVGGIPAAIANQSSADYTKLNNVWQSMATILKGSYRIDNRGEHIEFDPHTHEEVLLSNSSSGQQEVIRILQDIFLRILKNTIRVFRIVEEPEAHLFPKAQKHVVELLVQMAKSNENNQLFITTHSPYVLTAFNNLLFANRVVEKNPAAQKQVSKIVRREFQLSFDDFSAYVLVRNSNGRSDAQSLVDTDTGMIKQNYLDTVSETLGAEFNQLYNIHAQAFQRP
jgi:ABC-type lipoprotein export system ATPase subunit